MIVDDYVAIAKEFARIKAEENLLLDQQNADEPMNDDHLVDIPW